MNERLPKFVPNILKQLAPQEVDKVLSITFYAEVIKRNGDDELESLRIIKRVFKRKILSTGHRELEGVSQLKRNPSQKLH